MGRKKITLTFNSEIRERFALSSISVHDGLSYLLCLYYGTEPSFIPKELERRVLATKIVTKEYSSDTLNWNIPLFEETETGFEWLGEWMDLFKKVNPERRGTKAFVITRMKKFFVNNPSIRKDDVFQATERYLKEVSKPMYCKKSHKFIYEADGSSMLLDFVTTDAMKKQHKTKYNDDII